MPTVRAMRIRKRSLRSKRCDTSDPRRSCGVPRLEAADADSGAVERWRPTSLLETAGKAPAAVEHWQAVAESGGHCLLVVPLPRTAAGRLRVGLVLKERAPKWASADLARDFCMRGRLAVACQSCGSRRAHVYHGYHSATARSGHSSSQDIAGQITACRCLLPSPLKAANGHHSAPVATCMAHGGNR